MPSNAYSPDKAAAPNNAAAHKKIDPSNLEKDVRYLTGSMADGDLPVSITTDGSMDGKVRRCWESTFGGWR